MPGAEDVSVPGGGRPDDERSHAQVSCSATHCVALAHSGEVLTWATHPCGNRFGQLCRGAAERSLDVKAQRPMPVGPEQPVRVQAVAAGGSKETGHTVLLGDDGSIWACGCDRWQQLGLSGGLPSGSAVGYTWSDGRIWQSSLQEVTALRSMGVKACQAAGGTDHTVVLASNRQDVYTWGRGEHGQLGRGGRKGPFLASPGRSPVLSAPEGAEVAKVFADGNCSAAVHRNVKEGTTDVVSAGTRCNDLLSAISKSLRDL